MTTFLWWLRKEAREHRALLLLLLLAVPLGSWLAVHLLRGRPPTQDQLRERFQKSYVQGQLAPGKGFDPVKGPFPHKWGREEWEVMLLVSAAVAAAGIAGGLFGRESRRGTALLIARTPGAWRNAFAAKVIFLALVLGATLLVHGVLLGRLAEAYVLVDGWGAHRGVVETWALLPRSETWLAYAAVLAVTTWVLLASTSLPLVGVPVLVGALVAVAAAVPGIVWVDEHPFFFD